MPEPTAAERVMPWVLRGLWIVVLVVGGRAINSATSDGGGTADLLSWIGLGGWTIGVAAMAIPAAASLTATRAIAPLAVVVAAICWLGGADAVDGALFVGAAVIATVAAFSSGLGRAFVQASAYGDEDRHLLRPPATFALVASLAWVLWAAVAATAIAATEAEATILAGCSWALFVAGAVALVPRWHRLSRRWLVLVPAGVVLHDDLVLAETLMLLRRQIASIGLALADTDAADLTGQTPGHAVQITTHDSVTVLLGAASGRRAGTAIHLSGCLVAPSRPGQVLGAAAERRLPVGVAG